MSEEIAAPPLSVLIADDDADILVAAELLLTRHQMTLAKAATLEQARALLDERVFDVLLLDLNFQRGITTGAAGLEFLDECMARPTAPAVVVVTGHSGLAIAIKAMRAGAVDFVMKPWHNERLIGTIKAAAEVARTRPKPAGLPDLNLERSEQALVKEALSRHGHNISLAARDLGLTRAALYRRMEKYGL
jgi:DNA-binding NtrC family response regulator